MLKTQNEEYAAKILKFIEKHKDNYTEQELKYLINGCESLIDIPLAPAEFRQIYHELGISEINTNMYVEFIKLLKDEFDINRDIIEIGGGVIPTMAKEIALQQKNGTVTVYDHRLITTKYEHPENLILKREKYSKNTPIGDAKMLIGFMPCEATMTLIETACNNNLDFMVALCGCIPSNYGWIEEELEWIGYVKCCAESNIEKANLGTLGEHSLKKYKNPYPIIYNKRKS